MFQDISAEERGAHWKGIFYPIWTGQAFSLVSSAAVQFALIWWLTTETKSAVILSLASLAGLLPQAILGPFIGTLVDRHNRKIIMMASDLSIAFATLVIGVVFAYWTVQVWMIFTLLIFRSVGSAFHSIAFHSSVPLFVPEDKLMRASAMNNTIFSGANIAGPVLGGLMMASMKMQHIMLVDVAGACIASSMLLFVRIPKLVKTPAEGGKTGMINEMKFGFRVLSKYRGLMMISVVVGVVSVVMVPISALFPLMVNGYFRGSASQASVVNAVFATGMLTGSILLSVWPGFKKKVHTINSGVVLMGLGLICSGLLPKEGYMGFVVLCLFMGLSGPMYGTPYTVLFQTKIEPTVMGRVLSIVHSMMLLAAPVGLLIAGPVSELMGLPFWFYTSGTLVLAAGIWGFFVKSIRELEENGSQSV